MTPVEGAATFSHSTAGEKIVLLYHLSSLNDTKQSKKLHQNQK